MVLGHRGLAFATEPAKHRENASFAYNFCVNRLILQILTALESACLVPKLVKLSRYYITLMDYITLMARDIAAKKLRYVFNF